MAAIYVSVLDWHYSFSEKLSWLFGFRGGYDVVVVVVLDEKEEGGSTRCTLPN